MIRKTALLTGIAGLMLAAPAFAQDSMTPPAPAQTPPPAAAPAQPGTLSIQPGSDVKGSDGTVLGKLEGVRNNAEGKQELTVRGSDGQLRGVPLGGLKQDGTGVAVAWTAAEYQAAPAITGAPAARGSRSKRSPAPGAEPPDAPRTDDASAPDSAAPAPAEPQ